MQHRLSISHKNKGRLLAGILLILNCSPAKADVNGDEDETRYEGVVEPAFRAFHRKYGRFPKNWIELRVQDSCGGYYVDDYNHFPKRTESFIWKPSECELSYKLVFGTKSSFRVVALAKGHVVSVYENFRATFFKTPWHDHRPAQCAENESC